MSVTVRVDQNLDVVARGVGLRFVGFDEKERSLFFAPLDATEDAQVARAVSDLAGVIAGRRDLISLYPGVRGFRVLTR